MQLTRRYWRGKDRELSYACHLYAHKRCKGRICKCECHGNWIRGKDYDSYAIGQMMDEGGMDYSGAFESDIEE